MGANSDRLLFPRPRRYRAVLWAAALALWPGLLLAGGAEEPPVRFDDASSLVNFERVSLPRDGDGLGGAAWLDYDADGFLDLFLTNGKMRPNGLFRNDGHGGFVDVSASAGIQNGRGNSGVVAADFDNDGFTDLFVTGDGGTIGLASSPVMLYHNNRDGTFTDITSASGIVSPPSGISSAVADVDNDGFLDLFIAAPGSLSLQVQHANHLFRNNGDLTFTDISAAAGVNTAVGAFAALFTDYNRDGFVDLVVGNGNDIRLAPTPIELFRNNGDLTFTDVATTAGLAGGGLWMGFGPADYDNDGDVDLFVTNFGGNVFPHALYRNNGDGTYTSVGTTAGVAPFPFAWGCAFKDFDNDGNADLYFAGALPVIDTNPGVLLFNNGDGTFANLTASSPVDLRGMFPSGVASGDYDRNGFEDIVIVREPYGVDQSGRPVLLRNRGNANHWVTIRLIGTVSNRDAIGAQVWITAGGRTQFKEVYAGSSFASTDSPWLTFGLGATASIDRVRVRWPLGTEEEFRNIPAERVAMLVEGTSGDVSVGDCDGDGAVTVADLVQGVAIALGNAALDSCPIFDADGNGSVDVSDIVQAVLMALTED